MSKESSPIDYPSTDSTFGDRFFSWCRSFFGRDNAHRYAYFLPFILFFPALFSGLQLDDHLHYWRLHFYSENVSFWDASFYLFEFFQAPNTPQLEQGMLPWWQSTETSISFFRPITAWTHWLDAILWKDIYFMHHLHSLIWACLTVWVAHRLFVQLLGAGWSATMCTWVFACHDTHVLPFAWLANRNMSISFFFSMLSFSLYLKAQKEGKGSWRGLLLFSFSLLVAESSVSILGLLVAWAWVYIPSKKQALMSLFPYIGITIVWRILHKSMGYGAKGMHLYIDPANNPVEFLKELLVRFPILLLNLISKIPSELYIALGENGRFIMALGGIACTLSMIFLFRKAFVDSKRAKFWSLSIMLMLLPVCATYPMERLLFFASFSFSGLLLCIVHHHVGAGSKRFFLLHFPIAALLCIPKVLSLTIMNDMVEMGYRSIPEDFKEGQSLIYVNGPAFPALYSCILPITKTTTVPKEVLILSAAFDTKITVRDTQSIDMDISDGWFADMLFLRSTQHFSAGERTRRMGFEAVVQKVNMEQIPTQVHFVFDDPIRSDQYRWMKWMGDHYAEFELPNEDGTEQYIPAPFELK